MHLFHESRDLIFRNPTGALPCGSSVRIRLRADQPSPDVCQLRTWFGKESFYPMRRVKDDPALFEAELTMPETPCLLWYDFQVWENGQFFWYGNAEDRLGGVGALVYGSARSYQITVYDPAFQTPKWLDTAVFYQIFPDRFVKDGEPVPMDGRTLHADWNEMPEPYHESPDPYLESRVVDNGLTAAHTKLPSPSIEDKISESIARDFFGGNLSGIRQKLPYIASLGANAIYLNPVFFAAANHRYDTIDWHRIDPTLGTEKDFTELTREAEALGIRIILDGVFSHAGNLNPFFIEAKKDPLSPYREWFLFESWPDVYKSWWGIRTLPEMNKRHPDVIKYFITAKDSVVSKWLGKGASGWRIDVADELPMPYLRSLRKEVKQAGADHYLLGEVWEDASNKMTYGEMRSYCLGDTVDGVMNYPLRDAAIGFLLGQLSAFDFKRKMDSLYENYPPPFVKGLLNILSSHDRPRIINTLAGKDGASLSRAEQKTLSLSEVEYQLGKARVKVMLALILAMPGVPCIYYGDEIGMQGAADPFNRATYPWGDGDAELLRFFQSAIAQRKTHEAFRKGSLSIETLHGDVLAIRRSAQTGVCITVINRSHEPRNVAVDGQPVKCEGLSFSYFISSLT